MTFWLLWTIDLVVALIAITFFVIGLADGSVSSFNLGLWLLILAGLAGLLGGSLWLRARAREGIARVLLFLLAGPACLGGLLLLIVLLAEPRWN